MAYRVENRSVHRASLAVGIVGMAVVLAASGYVAWNDIQYGFGVMSEFAWALRLGAPALIILLALKITALLHAPGSAESGSLVGPSHAADPGHFHAQPPAGAGAGAPAPRDEVPVGSA
jgi:hypothetical protein